MFTELTPKITIRMMIQSAMAMKCFFLAPILFLATPMAMDYQMVWKSMLTGLTRWTTIQMTICYLMEKKSYSMEQIH
jgi:hypothetical protein